MTGDLKRQEVFYVGSGAPVTGDEITANTSAYPIGTQYLDKTNGAAYVRTGVGKVTGDWTSLGSSDSGSSYLVYGGVKMSQSGTDAPTVSVPTGQNTIGFGSWGRDASGRYSSESTTDFDLSKIWIGGLFINSDGVTEYAIFSSSSYDSPTYAYQFDFSDNGSGKIVLVLRIQDGVGGFQDLNGEGFMLPEIRYYS
jgi:hypothetical protein